MRLLTRFLSLFVGLIRWPLRLWVRSRLTPSDLNELQLDAEKPLCFVLAGGGLADRLTLEAVCAANGFERPRYGRNRFPTVGRPAVMPLPRGRAIRRSDLHRVVARCFHDDDLDVQVVPVSIFWGRNPVKETSLFRILFADSENAGRFRKLLIVLAQGRRVLVNLGQPVDYRGDGANALQPDAATRKMVRLLRVHFQRQRTATLGPPLSHRMQVINSILADSDVVDMMARVADSEDVSRSAVRARARKIADEIAADYSNIAIGFMLWLLTWLWNRIYDGVDVQHLQRLRETAHEASLVYLPSHRSHMDYLLVSYILYSEGLALPQIAAGINLNFWPVGGLLRRCGAFYLRRSFRGDKLYSVVFRAYINVLIGRGQPMKFYPEGGRSRTGRLLPPRTGLLSMVTTSFLRNRDHNVAIVPVYIGYDRVMEVNSYVDELGSSGSKKKNESVAGLVRSSRKILKRKYGRVYISFGDPLRLDRFADAEFPGWREWAPPMGSETRTDKLGEFTQSLAETAMQRINAAATLNATGLASLVLLGSPRTAVAEDEMTHTLDLLAQLARTSPYSQDTTIPEGDGNALLAEAEPLMGLGRVSHAWGDVLTVDNRQAVQLTYTRNNVMHMFALPSMLANSFSQRECCDAAEIVRNGAELYPLIASELFLHWQGDDIRTALEETLRGMIECGLIEDAGDGLLRRPPAGSKAFAALISLARIIYESLERYGMTVALLAHNLENGRVERSAFEQQCRLMAERVAILGGRNSPEFFDPRLFRNHLSTLRRTGLVRAEGSILHIDPAMGELAERTLALLGADMRQMILHLTSQSASDEADDKAGNERRE